MLSSVDKKLILSTDSLTLVLWWSELNTWKWPKQIPDEEPKEHHSEGRRRELMRYIGKIVGSKAISRVDNSDMSDAKFEKFWILQGDVDFEPD